MNKIIAWLPPASAYLKFGCEKPKNWAQMSAEEKFSYFEEHMEYTGEYSIEETEDCDWYGGLCESGDDFYEEEV